MRVLRLNTPAKRAAFGGVSGAADAHDAAAALHALSTKRLCDDRTAAGVLQACCGGEPTYNPFYAEVAKLRRSESKDFAFGLKLACWDAFKSADASEDARKAARRDELREAKAAARQGLGKRSRGRGGGGGGGGGDGGGSSMVLSDVRGPAPAKAPAGSE